MKKFSGAVSIAVLLTLTAFSQNQFEGYNLRVEASRDHRAPTCAVRYMQPASIVTITDLDSATPMRLTACDGSTAGITQSSAGSATIRAAGGTNKWCFRGEDEKYRITITDPQNNSRVTYDWFASRDARDRGFYNIRDFGAVGNGSTDDTAAFRSAMAVLASNNGGTLTIPDGEYIVSAPISLPSGVVIVGTNGLHSMASTSDVTRKNPSRITLSGTNRSLFQIGECVENVTFRDIELYAQSNVGTNGIEAFGAYVSSQGFNFDRVTFNNFNRGINAYGLPQTDLNWQFDYVKINASRFIYNRDTAVFNNVRNSDWKIQGSLFINPKRGPGQNANSMHFERVGMVLIQDTFGGGFPGALGGTFLHILDSGNTTIIASQTENMTNSLVYNEVENPYAGDYSYPITMVNSTFGNAMIFKARRTFVSTGSLYSAATFQADERLRVYSTGDRFCYDGATLGCLGAQERNFDRATVVFMTGQPADGTVRGHPTFFGTDVQFGAPVQMPSFTVNALPTGRANGSMAYCTNCRRGTTPCAGGGSGSPAMVVNGQWSCM
ncbi:MAG TPA: glycosyl hydrolase family 28-related protein [Pyrinomonadaceae bacterium]|nr:glycosyl hydrolase family 28-related protein [Pyrinomonadaceae bacterium]